MDWPEASFWASGVLIGFHILFLLYILYRKTGDPMSTAFWLMLAAVFPLGGFVLFLFKLPLFSPACVIVPGGRNF